MSLLPNFNFHSCYVHSQNQLILFVSPLTKTGLYILCSERKSGKMKWTSMSNNAADDRLNSKPAFSLRPNPKSDLLFRFTKKHFPFMFDLWPTAKCLLLFSFLVICVLKRLMLVVSNFTHLSHECCQSTIVRMRLSLSLSIPIWTK